MEKSLTIIIPAYDEEKNLEAAVKSVVEVVELRFSDYEILIFDDASHDKTGEIADYLAEKNPLVEVIHNEKNMNLGYNYRKGVELAQKKFILMVPGDNEIAKQTIADVLDCAGQADIIIPYTINPEIRSFFRRFLSQSYTGLINFLFGLNLRYYNGIVLHRAEILKKYKIRTNSFTYQTEILVNLVKRGVSFKEIPMTILSSKKKSAALRWKNIKTVILGIIKLFFQVRFKKINDGVGEEV